MSQVLQAIDTKNEVDNGYTLEINVHGAPKKVGLPVYVLHTRKRDALSYDLDTQEYSLILTTATANDPKKLIELIERIREDIERRENVSIQEKN